MRPYYEEPGITIYHGDCREVLPGLQVDVLITDPPFNVAKDYGSTHDDLPLHEYEALMRFIADHGPIHQAWVTPTNRLALFSNVLASAYPVVIQRRAQGPKRWGWYDQFDIVLVRGRPNRYVSNLWQDIRLKGEGYFFREHDFSHPGYTPFALMLRLADLLWVPDRVMVDPFCGTGTLLRAAKDLRAPAIGIEIEERYCELAVNRLRQGVLDLTG